MPTLDDLPTLAAVSASGDDLIPVYDLAGTGSCKVRKLSLNAVLGVATADITTGITSATAALTTRLNVTNLSANATGLVLPAASGSLREVIVVNPNATYTATVAAGSYIGAAAAIAASGGTARFLSNGTTWYRVA
jgi:hypothetical protein